MKNRTYSVIELVLSILFTALGIALTLSTSVVFDYIQYFMIGFIALKIVFIIACSIVYKDHPLFVAFQIALNIAIIVLLFIFKEADALSFVVSASVAADLITNIIRTIFFRKYAKYSSPTTFFGMENIIYLIFILLLVFNKESTLIAIGILFGAIILYKGISIFLNNAFVRSLINKTDFGKAVDKVHALDIFFGLTVLVVLASFIFPCIEEDVTSIGDGLWYCFTLITTIGTGDIVAKTVLGRILSVIIGFYGLIIVSILTSAIVVYLTNSNKKKE